MKSMAWGVVAAAALLAGPADARAHDDWRDGKWGHYGRRDAFGHGYERGFDDGANHGRKDARARRGFDFRHRDYREADNGYRGSYGPRREYAHGYRRGYEEGYRDAYFEGRGRHRGWARERWERRRHEHDRYDDDRRGRAHRHRDRDGWCYERHDDWDD